VGYANLEKIKLLHGKNGFVTATKLGTTNKFFVAATKNFAAATKRFVDRTKHCVVTKCFCYPYFNKDFVNTTKLFSRDLISSKYNLLMKLVWN